MPYTITVAGNKAIITSDPAFALEAYRELKAKEEQNNPPREVVLVGATDIRTVKQDLLLIAFARATLSILESENWSGDTLMEIASAAENRGLAETNEDGQFQSKLE